MSKTITIINQADLQVPGFTSQFSKIAIQTRSIFTFCAYWSPKGRWSNKPYDSQPKRNQIVAGDP